MRCRSRLRFLQALCMTFALCLVHHISPRYSVPALHATLLRLVFPTVQENQSAFAILPDFVHVCGLKLDKVKEVTDRASRVSKCLHCTLRLDEIPGLVGQARGHWDEQSERVARPTHKICFANILSFAKQLKTHGDNMKNINAKLEGYQKDCAATRSSRSDGWRNLCYIFVYLCFHARPEEQKELLQLFAECTKCDVALNNVEKRSRTGLHPSRSASPPRLQDREGHHEGESPTFEGRFCGCGR